MNTVKSIVLAATTLLAAAATTSCTDYQDEINALDNRVAYVESLVSQTNKDITNLQKVITAYTDGWYIENMAYLPADERSGYVINFRKDMFDVATGDSVKGMTQRMAAIVHDGEKGDQGVKGDQGTNATNMFKEIRPRVGDDGITLIEVTFVLSNGWSFTIPAKSTTE